MTTLAVGVSVGTFLFHGARAMKTPVDGLAAENPLGNGGRHELCRRRVGQCALAHEGMAALDTMAKPGAKPRQERA